MGVLKEAARWGLYNYVGPLQSGAEEKFRLGVLSQLRSVPGMSGAASGVSSFRHIASNKPDGLVVVGASTGGTRAVEQIVQSLHPELACAVLVAVHLPAHFTASFVKRLQRLSSLPVKIGQVGMSVEAGQIIVAPGGQNMVVKSVERGPWQVWQIDFSTEPSPGPDQPSVDMLMHSAAQAAGSDVVGIILTGLGSDGTYGARCIQERGGQVITQNEESAAVFSMPHSVIRAGYADAVLPLEHIATAVNQRSALPTPDTSSYSSVETLN
jgi:two-component system chemotaxis response regulator CheB